MDFSAEQANQIMQATKTTHRIPAKGKKPRRGKLLDVKVPTRDEDGRVVSRRRHSHRVRVLSVDMVFVEDITDAQAKPEGFKSREKFLDAYEEMHGKRRGPCWVLTFEVAEPLRILKPAGAPGHTERGYGGGPDVIEAGDGVDDDTLDSFASENTRRHDAASRLRDAERVKDRATVEARLAAVLDDAKERGVDVRSVRRKIERQVAHLERRVYDRERAA